MIKSVEELERVKGQFLTAAQAAEALGVKPGTLEKWRRVRRHYLPFSKIGKTIRYRGQDVAALFEPKAVADRDVQPGGRRRRRGSKAA